MAIKFLNDLIASGEATFQVIPTVGTRTAGDSTTYAASTAFVTNALGSLSTPFEFNTTSTTGIQSIQAGYNANTASGVRSIAMGDGTSAGGIASTAMGYQTTASAGSSTAMGNSTEASGSISTAMGFGTEASGYASIAIGSSTEASGSSSTAMGSNTEASGVATTAMGKNTTASGFNSTAMGFGTTASGLSSVSMGQFNVINSSDTPTTFALTNTAFSIGNGTTAALSSDAFKVLFNGTTTIAGSITGTSIIKSGGLATQFLMADGTVTTASAAPSNATITLAAGTGLTTGGDFTLNQAANETITFNVGAGDGIRTSANNVTIDYSSVGIVNDANDGTSVTLADTDEFIFEEVGETETAVKRGTLSQLKTYIGVPAGTVTSIGPGDFTTIDATDPAVPIVNVTGTTLPTVSKLVARNASGLAFAATPASGSSDTTLATTAFVQNKLTGLLQFKGGFNATTGILDDGSGDDLYTDVVIAVGDYYVVSTAGNFFSNAATPLTVGDSVIAQKAVLDPGTTAAVEGDFVVVQSDTDLATLATVGIGNVAPTANQIGVTYANGTGTLTNLDRGSSQNIFKTITAPVGGNVVADSNTDTLNFTASGGMTITNTPGTDTVNFSSVNNNTEYTAGTGLTLSAGNEFSANVNATAQTVAANGVTATAARTYAVQVDSSDDLVVNVPWPASAGGSVTSVSSTTAGDALDVAVTNETISPALAFTFAGATTQYINGQGNLITFPAGSGGTVTSVATTHAGNAFTASIGGVSTVNPSVNTAMAGTALQYINGLGNLITFPTLTSGTVTSVGAANGTFISSSSTDITISGDLTYDLSATGTPGDTTFLRGDNSWETIPGGLTLGTTAGTALEGNTVTISTTQAANIVTNNGKDTDTGLPAILNTAGTASLTTGITALEIRTLIGAGTGSGTGNGTVTGTGTSGYIPKFNAAGTGIENTATIFNDANGNVGIGTNSPNGKLHVSTGNNLDSGDLEFVIGGSVNVSARAGTIIKNTSSPYEMKIRASRGTSVGAQRPLVLNDLGGVVGIGTPTPTQLLHISSTGPAKLLIEADTDNVTESDTAGIILSQDGGAVNSRLGFATSNILEIVNESAFSLILGTNNTPRMYINSSGLVGIGTTTPNTLLDIASGSIGASAPTARITSTAGFADWSGILDDLGRFEFFTDDESGNAPYSLGYVGIKNDYTLGTPTLPSGAMVFATTTYNAPGGAVERMRISSTGAVKFNAYGAGILVTDASGNITASTTGGGAVIGTGTSGYVTKWNAAGTGIEDTNTIFNGLDGRLNINNTFIGTPNAGTSPDLWIAGKTVNQPGRIYLMNTTTNAQSGTINGSIEFGPKDDASNGYTNARIIGKQTSNSGTGNGGEGQLEFQTSASGASVAPSTKMTIDSAGLTTIAGDLTLNTISPSILLKAGTQNVAALGDLGANTDGQLALYNSSGTLNVLLNGDNQSNYIANGNLGIGVTNPSEKLVVQGSVNNDDIGILINNTFDDNNPASAPASALRFQATSNNGHIRVFGAPNDTASKHRMDIGSTAGSSFLTFSPGGAERMRIATDGTTTIIASVGIGTTAPLSKLHVSGGGSAQTTLTIGASGTSNDKSSKLFFNEGESGVTDSKDFGFSLAYNGSGNSYPGLVSNEFGIIRHNNSANGDVIMKIARTSNNTTFTGTVTATNFILSSDERFKENIKTLEPKKIDVKWKSFNLKTDEDYRTGVIAQELEKTNPEFVRENSEGFKSVAYIDLLIAKIAELEARLEKLEK